jgi:hypothetical protein
LNRDVCDVHRVIDVSHVLHWRRDVIAQNRFTNVANLAKVVILRTDIELDVHLRTNGLAGINDPWAARRQRRPANVIAACPPGDPCRTPIKILARKPDPSIIGKVRPAAVVVRSPAEIFVRDPCPTVISVGPISVRVRTPALIVYGYVGLPAVSVTFNVNPVSAGKILVKVIDGYFLSPRLLKSRRTKNKHS